MLYNVYVFVMYYDRMQNTDIDKMERHGGIRFFCFLKHEAGFSCSSELDHLSHLLAYPWLPKYWRWQIEFRSRFISSAGIFFIAYWVQLRKQNLCDWLLVLLTNSPAPFFFFFFRFIQFILVCVEIVLFNQLFCCIGIESVILFLFFFSFIINSFLYWIPRCSFFFFSFYLNYSSVFESKIFVVLFN